MQAISLKATRMCFKTPVFLLCLLVLWAPNTSDAMEVGTARTAADNFLRYLYSEKQIREVEALHGISSTLDEVPMVTGYLCHLSGGGIS